MSLLNEAFKLAPTLVEVVKKVVAASDPEAEAQRVLELMGHEKATDAILDSMPVKPRTE